MSKRSRKYDEYEDYREGSGSKRRSEHRRNQWKTEIYDFETYKSKLVKIFFGPTDLIPHGSSEYRDFWNFLRKYQSFERSKLNRDNEDDDEEDDYLTDSLQVPFKYDKSLTTNIRLLPSDTKDLLNKIPFQDSSDRVLTEGMIKKFRFILTQYIEFLQKEKFEKLKKLRKAQANLPIADYRTQIIDSLKTHQVLIIAGDTGCGKSTQVPQYLLQAGYENIACTQPRRLACIALANRVGYETLNQYGTEIGYQIRFEKKKTDHTRVLFVTEGLLLRQVVGDSSLSNYNVIVLDEVHERHLTGDFLLGIVKCLIRQRKDLKVILMSATINIKLFQDYFRHENAPVVQVPGRLYPIKLQYFPISAVEQSSQSEKLNPAPYIRILQLIDKKYSEKERGDVLIFLSGVREITTVMTAAKDYAEKNGKWIVLPLHSTLSLVDQDKVFDFAPEGVRKCIVSTNIAETSITIDGIRFVVDSGKVKEMHYDPVCKMRRLKEFWISRASAEQRKGRSGRTGPGVCFRLYSDSEYKALTPFSAPEIQRVPLDGLILQMISMGLPDARKFPFIEPPPPESLENSILNLKEQGALNDDETLTVIGSMLSNLPVDVSLGKMLIMGTLFDQMESVLSLAGALSVQSPFTNDAFQNPDCVAARRNLDSDHGDPITLMNAYREWLQIKSENRENSRQWCRKRGLEEQRFYELTKLRGQFKELLEQSKLLTKDEKVEGKSGVERSVRHGELKHLRAMKREWHKKENGNKTKKVLKMRDFPGSTLDDNEDDDGGGGQIDIKDIEFRLKHDNKRVQELLEGAKAYTYKDLNILKLILTSGLYPQFAVADEFNDSKASGADQLFHTKVKPFNVLHPNSNFAANPEYITIDGIDKISVAGFPSKYPVSAKHQILVYLSLLETNKPYIVNTFRMPALQTLLLFARTVDVNGLFSKIVFDSWLELRFPDYESAQNLVFKATSLRSLWQNFLQMKLVETQNDEDVETDTAASAERQRELRSRLSRELIDFIHTETPFSIRRLLPGDLKVLYTPGNYSALPDTLVNPLDESFPPVLDETKGGIKLTDYVTYDCMELNGDEFPKLFSDFTCPLCDKSEYVSVLQRMNHYKGCLRNEELQREKGHRERQNEDDKKADPNAKEYYCSICEKTLRLTATEILRHKRKHASSSSSSEMCS